MLLLFLVGSGPSAPIPPATNYDQYLYGAAQFEGVTSLTGQPSHTAPLSDFIEGLESHPNTLSTQT